MIRPGCACRPPRYWRSSNIARALVRVLDETTKERVQRGDVQLVSISPETSRAIRELGLPVAAEAATYTTGGVIEALVNLNWHARFGRSQA